MKHYYFPSAPVTAVVFDDCSSFFLFLDPDKMCTEIATTDFFLDLFFLFLKNIFSF